MVTGAMYRIRERPGKLSGLHRLTPRERREIEYAQRAVNRVALYRSVYSLPHRATRIAAFVIAARLEAEREALA